VNPRNSRKGVAFYNRFGGDIIPYISKNKLNKAMKNALEDNEYKDLTDREFDSLEYRNMIIESQIDSAMDNNLVKISARYIDMPALNKDVPLIVTNISKGVVNMPDNGVIITFGENVPKSYIPKVGDKIFVRFSTSSLKKIKFINAVTGTPRLVRKGVPRHEAEMEGTKSSNFIKTELPRTAIGSSKDRKKIYLVTFEGTNPSVGKKGASLASEALAMKRIGAFDAVNLDGGGSSNMIINGKNVMSKADPNKTRRLSIGIGVGFKKKLNSNKNK
jgi:exopolysaccharide biosynthesis protein